MSPDVVAADLQADRFERIAVLPYNGIYEVAGGPFVRPGTKRDKEFGKSLIYFHGKHGDGKRIIRPRAPDLGAKREKFKSDAAIRLNM